MNMSWCITFSERDAYLFFGQVDNTQ